jgi:hypothetical protein
LEVSSQIKLHFDDSWDVLPTFLLLPI